MSERKTYWPTTSDCPGNGAILELRSALAWELLERFALVAGDTRREDSAGRAVLDIMPAEAVVTRAFNLADLFVAAAEARGELRPFTDADKVKAFAFGGKLSRLKYSVQFPRGQWRETVDAAADELYGDKSQGT